MTAKEFLGVGWRFPPGLDAGADIALEAYESDIDQAIRIIIGTAPGERLMRPDFGCGIHNMVFAALSLTALGQVENSVKEALVRWEPRIELDAVHVSLEQAQEGRLMIAVDYRVRSTNNRFNLVYPFYLKEQG